MFAIANYKENSIYPKLFIRNSCQPVASRFQWPIRVKFSSLDFNLQRKSASLLETTGYPNGEGDAEEAGQYVGDSLGEHDALQAQEAGQDKQRGDEEEALATNADESAADRHTDDLEKHVGSSGHPYGDESHTLVAQHLYADGQHGGILIAIKSYDIRGE